MTQTVMTINELMKYLPQRPPFLFIDRVIELVPQDYLVAIKNVTMNEAHFLGHFPQRPVMPGVLILEALAQAATVLAFKSLEAMEQKTASGILFFAGIDNARFKRIVEPGDQLILEVKLIKVRKNIMCVAGTACVGDEIACTADLMSARKED